LWRSLRHGLTFAFVRALIWAAGALPRRSALRLFSTLGALAFYLLPKARVTTEVNLSMAMPGLSRAELRNVARQVWSALGKNCLDVLRFPRTGWDELEKLVRVEGLETLEEAVSRGRGVIAITGHIGSWEMLAAYFSMRGYPLSVLARPLRDDRLEALLDSLRRGKGMRPISRIANARPAYESLKKGDILGVLIDQDTPVKGVFCDFFGRPAFTPAGPAYLAMRTGAAVVPMAISMQSDGTHLVRILEPVDAAAKDGDDKDRRALEITAECTRSLERLIRYEPTQWVWMHERWKTRPEQPVAGRAN
jgi:KDO2-lipid IV(A) lauroyltransferase